ncbi:hypothetical protein ABZX98_32655 [Streptomyces sp. NPDC002992]|uniref:hypothetical protein n=1 Tax=Streptomyces sp. NPDC002992 TaxID=3154273 RepID=UPI0033AAC505
MTYGLLTPDVPLGPFEGACVTVWSAQGREAKLHSKSSCSYLRSARATQREVRLDASAIGKLCTQCAAYGSWARPGTGLAIFLDTVTGLGLLYELGRFCQADEDSFGDEEVDEAACLLLPVSSDSDESARAEEEDESWEELREARQVRETVFAEWLDALTSLHRVHHILDLFPWLKCWAEPKVQRKADYLQVLRARAGRLVAPGALALAAAVSVMKEPDVPADDPAFALLGAPAKTAGELTSLWQRWRSRVESSWDHPREQEYLVHHLARGMSSRRKGYDRMLEQAQMLLGVWEAAARSATAEDGQRVLLGRLADDGAPAAAGRGGSAFDRLSEWEQGALASYTVAVDWGRSAHPVFSLRVPQPVATRLLSQPSVLVYELLAEEAPEAGDGSAALEADGWLQPGVFDDTPVHGRRLVRKEHLRALRGTAGDAEQLYTVLGMDAGVEVVTLGVLEQRCAAGWQGVILAAASDLPDALVEASLPRAGEAPEDDGVWARHVYDPEQEDFGRRLSAAEGERVLVRLCEERQDVRKALKSLVLARSVADLRDLEAIRDDRQGYPLRPFVAAVWNGLLAMEQLDLEPFASAEDEDWPDGSGLPLGVLASVQAYTTDAFGRFQGRAHSPGCAHRHPYGGGVNHRDDRASIEELLGNKEFDPCSKCGGYAVRRLSDTQVAYYRAAHRLHHLIQLSASHHRTTEAGEYVRRLDELSNLDTQTAQAWFPVRGQASRWRQVTHRLRAELQNGTSP